MNRASWNFPYTADKLLDAANTKKAFHESRLNVWTAKMKEVENKIQTEGIQIDRSVADQMSSYAAFSNSGRRAPAVTIEQSLVNDFHECSNKVEEHKEKIKSYEAWTQVLASQGQSTFNLNQDDWLFFFGK